MRWQKTALNLLYSATVVAFVVLVISNWRLRRSYDALQAQFSAFASRAIVPFHAGDVMPKLEVVDRAGHPVTIRTADWKRDSYVALVLPGCGPCSEQISAAENAKLPNVVLICLVSREAAAKKLENVSAGMTLYFVRPSTAASLHHRLDGFPRILRVSAEGKITATCRSIVGCGGPSCTACDLPAK